MQPAAKTFTQEGEGDDDDDDDDDAVVTDGLCLLPLPNESFVCGSSEINIKNIHLDKKVYLTVK